MNISSMLAYGPTLKSAPVKDNKDRSESHSRQAQSAIKKGNAKYREKFELFPDMTASSVQIAGAFGYSTAVATKQLKIMSERKNPVVKIVGDIPHARNGCPTYIWKWIGPAEPLNKPEAEQPEMSVKELKRKKSAKRSNPDYLQTKTKKADARYLNALRHRNLTVKEIATQPDNSALREHDAKLVEKIAQGDSDLNYSGLLHIADKIRKGEF